MSNQKKINDTRKLGEKTDDSLKQSRILVVDDEESIRSFLSEALSSEGYKVEIAEDCEKAKEILNDQSFSLIISDINLPGMSGDEFLEFCKKKYKNTEIILITGAPGLDNAVEAVKKGAFDYLPKPISLKKLYERAREALIKAKTKPNSNPVDNSIPGNGYNFIRTLGAGNMAVVLLVEKNKKHYAMKILKRDSETSYNDLNTQRFIREAEILSQIEHPNIVKVIEFGQSQIKKMPFIVMEYVKGEPLNRFMEYGKLTFDKKVSIVRQIASALHIVHNYGILHRDVKPGNILLSEDYIVKLTDFGIAGVEDSNLTMTKQIMGSPAYMSPESYDYSVEKDHRSDIFSLGIIAYELFTGAKPFHGDSINQIMQEIKTKRPVEPMKLVPDLNPAIQDILAKMLAKDPDDRFDDAAQIVNALDRKGDNKAHKEGFTAKLLRTLILRKPTWS